MNEDSAFMDESGSMANGLKEQAVRGLKDFDLQSNADAELVAQLFRKDDTPKLVDREFHGNQYGILPLAMAIIEGC